MRWTWISALSSQLSHCHRWCAMVVAQSICRHTAVNSWARNSGLRRVAVDNQLLTECPWCGKRSPGIPLWS